MKLTTYQYTVPSIYLSYFINADTSGLNEQDMEYIDHFMDNVNRVINGRKYHWGEYRDRGFTYCNDIHNLGCECAMIDLIIES